MNYLFLTEDGESLRNVLPYWLDFMNFGCQKVDNFKDIKSNNYIIQTGNGIEKLFYNGISRAINNIKEFPVGTIDKLIIILDAENESVDFQKNRVQSAIDTIKQDIIIDFDIYTFVCDKCFETWLLGNMAIYPDNILKIINKEFLPFYEYYDISKDDPQNMNKPLDLQKSISFYHFQYLHNAILNFAKTIHNKGFYYRKSNPKCAKEQSYFNVLVERANTTNHISTFKEFYDFIIAERENNK